MPNVRLPLSGDVLQTINPWNWFLQAVGSQVGLVNINLGRSADPKLEEEILNEGAATAVSLAGSAMYWAFCSSTSSRTTWTRTSK